jgi:WD40 repeat protein
LLVSGPGRDFPYQLLFSPDSQQLAVATGYYDVTLWQADDGSEIHEWTEIGDHILFHPIEGIIATWRDAISQWNIDEDTFINVFNQHVGHVTDLAVFPNSDQLAIASSDSFIYLRQLQTGELFTSLKAGINNETFLSSPSVSGIDVTADGQTLVSASNDAYRVWDLNDYSMTTLSPIPRRDIGAQDIAISPD